jgi:hypothetical protein
VRRCVLSRNLENEEPKARYRAVKIQPLWVVTPGKQTNKAFTVIGWIKIYFLPYFHIITNIFKSFFHHPYSVNTTYHSYSISLYLPAVTRNPQAVSASLQLFLNKAVFIKPVIYPSSSVVPCIAFYWAQLDHYFILPSIIYILFYWYKVYHLRWVDPSLMKSLFLHGGNKIHA